MSANNRNLTIELLTVPAIFCTRWSKQIQLVTEKATFVFRGDDDMETKIVNLHSKNLYIYKKIECAFAGTQA